MPDQKPTKLQQELSNIGGTAQEVVDDINFRAPPWIPRMFNAVVNHPGTPWFFFGSAIEALGITIQYQYFEASYPIADFIVGFGLFFLFAYIQAKKKEKDDEEE